MALPTTGSLYSSVMVKREAGILIPVIGVKSKIGILWNLNPYFIGSVEF
jgi:hypothetical protein